MPGRGNRDNIQTENSLKQIGAGGYIHLGSHYSDVIMDTIAFQITSLTIVYSTVYSAADQRKHQSSASLAFVQKLFPSDDVIMIYNIFVYSSATCCLNTMVYNHKIHQRYLHSEYWFPIMTLLNMAILPHVCTVVNVSYYGALITMTGHLARQTAVHLENNELLVCKTAQTIISWCTCKYPLTHQGLYHKQRLC